MPKVTINGSTGITAYEPDNTTVAINLTPAELVAMKPNFFKSASPFIISGGVRLDTAGASSVLRFSDGTNRILDVPKAVFVTKNTESFTNGDQNHTMPFGIQQGDILIMAQATGLRTGPGYSPPENHGDGFINVNHPQSYLQQWYWHPTSGLYDLTTHLISYKVAGGSESGTDIGGFCSGTSSYGGPRGHRTLYVYRPTFVISSVSFSSADNATTNGVSTSFPSHQLSTSITGSSTDPVIGIVQYSAGNANKTPSVSGAVTSFDSTTNSNSSYGLSTIFTGAFSSASPTGSVGVAGPSGQTVGDALAVSMFTLLGGN